MKLPLAVLGLALPLCLFGCKGRQSPTPAAQTVPAATPSAPAATPSPEMIAAKARVQLESTVRVTISTGSAAPRQYTGALLHSDQLAEQRLFETGNHCVLTLLRGWAEEQL